MRNASLLALVAALTSSAAFVVSGCGKSPAAADGLVIITETTSTTTTTIIPDVAASGVVASPDGVGLAAATLFTLALASPPTGGVPPYTISWDFGDGSAPVTGPTGAHKYLDPGDFVAVATITDTRAKSVQVSLPVTVGTVSGDWGIEFARVVATHGIDLVQNQDMVTAAVNRSPYGTAAGSGGVANPRALSLSVSFADAKPAPFVATFIGTLDDDLLTWRGTATGYPGCPCDFTATR